MRTATALETFQAKLAQIYTADTSWKPEFDQFSAAHGGNPVNFGSRLLFADGWMYSGLDYSGPCWAAPDDPNELRSLKRSYWELRLAAARSEIDELVAIRSGVKKRSFFIGQTIWDRLKRQAPKRIRKLERIMSKCEQMLHDLKEEAPSAITA